MFNSFSKNLEDTASCQSSGICTLNPIINALDELILHEIREITFYTIKSRELAYENEKIANSVVKALCINFLNSNFPEKYYLDFFKKLIDEKNFIKNTYKNLCRNNAHPCEVLTPTVKIKLQDSTLVNLIIEGEKFLATKNKAVLKDNVKLFELIVVLVKWTCVNIEKIKDFQPDFKKYDFEILRFFNLTNFPATRSEKLKRRINEFLEIAYEVQKKLNEVFIENYGEKTDVNVSLSTKAGKSILVGGDNLRELELLLEAIGDRNINVYTYELLFIAHFYPKFQGYKNLKGHIKDTDASYDFGNFKGSIFITNYCTQKIDNIYKGFIYTSNFFAPKGIAKIQDNNFNNLIDSTLLNEGYTEDAEDKTVFMRYNKQEIRNIIEDTTRNEIVIFMGKNGKEDFSKIIENKAVINIDNPIEFDLLFYALELARQKNLKTDVVFTMCNAKTVNLALCLKSQNVDNIYLSRCPKYNITPRINGCLKEDFEIKTIN